jgi:D-ribulokinase
MTDGCASQVSTGAVAPGQWSSTLGTTLVIKGVSRELIRDPLGRVYCHRHPDGHWLPGGASNVGGDCVARRFHPSELAGLNEVALERSPTDVIAYPLETTGERFPFARPDAAGFILGNASERATHYVACLEGVANVERMAYDVLESLGAEVGNVIYVAGGGTRSAPWCQIRADVLGRALKVPAQSGGAMGAAIIAAGGTLYPGIVPAAKGMVRLDAEYAPRSGMKRAYDERYELFRAECARRGYID